MLALSATAVAGAVLVVLGLAAASAWLLVIGAAWLVLTAAGVRSLSRWAWVVWLDGDRVTFRGPRRRLSMPALAISSVRVVGAVRNALVFDIAGTGSVRFGPLAEGPAQILDELRKVNPAIRGLLPDG